MIPAPKLTMYRRERYGASPGAARFGVRQSHAAFASSSLARPRTGVDYALIRGTPRRGRHKSGMGLPHSKARRAET